MSDQRSDNTGRTAGEMEAGGDAAGDDPHHDPFQPADWPAVSVIVVSHGRADLLPRCIASLRTLTHRPFEVIVVADTPGLAALKASGDLADLKTATLDEPNISKARNIGIALAAAPLTAVLDDDAVARPDWLTRLVAGFALPGIAAAGGYVIGRNGFSYQWKARRVDALGQAVEFDPGAGPVCLPDTGPDHAVKLEGTNCAFRTGLLRQMGGFDEGFRFYLDETDLCWRLHATGHPVALIPGALVDHGFAASARRGADRVPKSLREIGASSVLYLRKHAPESARAGAIDDLRRQQWGRLTKLLGKGRLTRDQLQRLLDGLASGLAEGEHRASTPGRFDAAPPPFKPFPAWGQAGRTKVLAGRPWQKKRLFKRASALAAQGVLAHVIILWPSARVHRRWFDPRGFWVQEGGLFGRADRAEPLFRLTSFRRRVAREAQAFPYPENPDYSG